MPTFTSDYAAIRAIETRLVTVFGTTYAASYTSFGGVDVKVVTDEDDEPENVGKPLILLEQTSGTDSEISSAQSEYRDVTVTATTYVSDFIGAQVGTANPTASDELLSIDLVKEFDTNYATWRDLGLLGIKFKSGSMAKANDSTTRRISHQITFAYNRA